MKDSKESKLLVKPKKQLNKEKFPEYYAYQEYIKSAEWQEIRQLVLQRDNYHCTCCGRSLQENAVLSIHHNSYDHLFDERNHLDCLTTLCKVCHASIHRNKNNWQRFKKKPSKK